MGAVRINTGPIDATAYLQNVPREQWVFLVHARRTFLQIRLPYDCRELLRFVEEAQDMLQPLGYVDMPDFIRRGLDLDPSLVQWAVSGLQALQPDDAIPFDRAVHIGRSQQAAQQTTGENAAKKQGERTDLANLAKSQIERAKENSVSHYTQRKLDRLARDYPDLLEQVKAGALSPHRAGIAAGFIRELTPLDALKRLWKKTTEEERRQFIQFIQHGGDVS